MHFLEGVHRLIDHQDAQRRGGRLAVGAGHAEADLALGARQVNVAVGLHVDPEVVGRLHVHHAAVADDLAAGQHLVRMNFQRAEQARRQIEIVFGFAVLHVQPLRQHGLAGTHHVQVDGRQPRGGAHVHPDRLAGLVDRLVQPQQHVLAQRLAVQGDGRFRRGALGVGGLGGQVEEVLPAPHLDLLAAHHLNIVLARRAGVELLRPGRDLELGQSRRVGLERGERLAFRLIADPQLHVAPGRAAVGVGRRREDAVLQAGRDATALRQQADAHGLIAHRVGPHDRLGVVGGVGDLGFDLDQGVALLQRLADEVIRQPDFKLGVAPGIGLQIDRLKVLEGHVEGAGRDLDLGAGHRLAEEIVALKVRFDLFFRQVVLLVGRHVGLEFGQDVRLDRDGLVGRVVAEDGPDVVVAGVDLVGELEVSGGDAEIRRFQGLLEDLVALAVLDFKGEVGPGRRLEVERPQRQRPQVHELSRLVERLVTDEQHLGRRLDLHVAFQLLLAEVGLREDLQFVLAGRQVGRLEANVRHALGVGLALEEVDALARVGDQLHFHRGAGQRHGFGVGFDAVDLAAQGGRGAGEELLAARKRGLMGLDQQHLGQRRFHRFSPEGAAQRHLVGRCFRRLQLETVAGGPVARPHFAFVACQDLAVGVHQFDAERVGGLGFFGAGQVDGEDELVGGLVSGGGLGRERGGGPGLLGGRPGQEQGDHGGDGQGADAEGRPGIVPGGTTAGGHGRLLGGGRWRKRLHRIRRARREKGWGARRLLPA